MGSIFPRGTSIPGDTRAGTSHPRVRRWRSFPTTGGWNSARSTRAAVQIARMFHRLLADHPHWDDFGFEGEMLAGRLKPLPALFPEEERSKQPSAFSILRALIEEFRGEEDSRLGLVGAFGYDLLFQFEPIEKKLPRARPQGSAPVPLRRHLVHGSQEGTDRALSSTISSARASTTRGLARDGEADRAAHASASAAPSSATTRRKSTWRTWRRCARACAAATTTKWCCARPSARRTPARPPSLFERVQKASPSPYEFLLQFGEEQLVGASPEMFVRVEGAPRRDLPHLRHGAAHRRSAARRRQHSRAAEVAPKKNRELTMCTDVDRNDKSRVCEPGTVKVIGRRLIECYAGVFHTVDHVEGYPAGGLRFARRVPQPHVGGDGDRRAQEGGGAGRREAWRRTRAAGTAARSA